VGIATGLGYYALAALTTIFAVTVLFVIGKLERYAKSELRKKQR